MGYRAPNGCRCSHAVPLFIFWPERNTKWGRAFSRRWQPVIQCGVDPRGETSGYEYLQQRGRIPNAIPIGDADDKAQLYQTADGRLLPLADMAARWTQLGLKASGHGFEREVIFYCGSGWRSSLTFLYAYLLGYENIRNYSDGWSGWSTTYQAAAREQGLTPGWRQGASGRPRRMLSAFPHGRSVL